MTVTNYFPRKEDLALDIHAAFHDSLASARTTRSEGESALATALAAETGTLADAPTPRAAAFLAAAHRPCSVAPWTSPSQA